MASTKLIQPNKVVISRFDNEFRLETVISLGASIEKVFAFFADAKNLEDITPPMLSFRVVSFADGEMREGKTIDYRLRIHGLPIRWTSLISQWQPPHRFVDEQIRGPYRYWIHHHIFIQNGDETLVKDIVRYQVFGGQVFHRLFVKKDLINIFSYRQLKLIELFS